MPSSTLEDRLRTYSSLSAEERRALAAEIAGRPDLAASLAEAQALADVADAASGDPSVAERVVEARLGHSTEADFAPEEETHASNVREALDRQAREGEAPLAQFERLSGHVLEPDADAGMRPFRGRIAGGDGHPTDSRAARLAVDRVPARPVRKSPLRWAAAAGLVLAMVYGGLFAGSSWMLPEDAQVADVENISATFRPVRGADRSDDYDRAVRLVNDARVSTLGLFPRYENEGLEEAADLFAEIASDSPTDLYGQEAALAIGRIRLYQGQTDKARIALESAVARGSYRAPEAVRLLNYIDNRPAAE